MQFFFMKRKLPPPTLKEEDTHLARMYLRKEVSVLWYTSLQLCCWSLLQPGAAYTVHKKPAPHHQQLNSYHSESQHLVMILERQENASCTYVASDPSALAIRHNRAEITIAIIAIIIIETYVAIVRYLHFYVRTYIQWKTLSANPQHLFHSCSCQICG